MRIQHHGILVLLLAASCAATTQGPQKDRVPAGGPADARTAVTLLRNGSFPEAAGEAERVLQRDPQNAQARLVRAITRYKAAAHQLNQDVRSVLFSGFRGGINHQYLRWTVSQADAALTQVDMDLLVATRDRGVNLELCLACWKVDWNNNRRLDSADDKLFQIEIDEKGDPLPDEDPRRRPTFRFDLGDVYWARAMISFQRAALNLLLAYSFQETADQIVANKTPKFIRFALIEPQRVAQARKLILEGLAHSDRCRKEYLAETDDDREWVPNPRQKNHPLPLPVDDRLYQTWEGVIGDLRRLVAGEEGLSVAEVSQLGRHQWDTPPMGYLNLGVLLTQPKDIVVELKKLDFLDRRVPGNTEDVLHDLLGEGYVQKMRPSRLIMRLQRMRDEVEHGKESLERKLRYLFWLN